MQDLANKFLGMNKETRMRTVGAVVIYVINFLVVFHIINFTNEQVEAITQITTMIITGIAWYLSHYYNNDFTEEAARHTGAMRQEKLEKKADYVGDMFYTEEPYDDEEESDEQDTL